MYWIPVLLIAGLVLTGCGFRPLHSVGIHGKKFTPRDLSGIRIDQLDNRNGQMVRNLLIELFSTAENVSKPRYRMSIKIRENKEGLGLQRDDTVTRFNLRMSGSFSLIETKSKKAVLNGKARSIAAYNVVRSDYANLVAQSDARRRATRAIAEDIRNQTVIFLGQLQNIHTHQK